MKLRHVLGKHYTYPVHHRLFEFAGILTFFGFSAIVFQEMMAQMEGLTPFWGWCLLLTSLASSYIAADFASGFVHWLGDTFGEPHWPVLGSSFIRPFREHHTDPTGICRHDFIEINGNSCIWMLFYIVPVYFLLPSTGAWAFFCLSFSLFFTWGIFFTNQFHKWAHLHHPPTWIATLQRFSLILSPRNHNVHHSAPYKTYYCITNGWMNPVLDKLNFWRLAESVVSWVTKRDYSGDPAHRTQGPSL